MTTIVYSQGSFDLLHSGHVNFLRQCAQLGNVNVSVISDVSYRCYRGHPPVMCQDERLAVVQAIKYVDHAFIGDNRQTFNDLMRLRANIAAIGSDWASKDIYNQWRISQQWLDEKGILLVYLPYTPGISSSAIKTRLAVAA